jgi:ferredoxin
MKVRVEPTQCEGFGKCAKAAPAIFKLDDYGYADLDLAVDVPPDLEEAVREAAKLCPTAAVIIEE